jgi:hypothetical protein
MEAVHEDGHEGVHRTLHRLRRDFHFPNMRHLVQEFVRSCPTCQRYKSEHLHPAGLLMPLPVPSAVWVDIGLDFVEALPRVNGKTVILSVVDRFSKYCHFIPLAHPYTTAFVAHAFFTDIVRLHGVLQSIVSDRDLVFTSTFWKELMRLMGTKLHMTSAFHPQSDRQPHHRDVPALLHRRLSPPVAALVAVGRVHLQHRVPDFTLGHAVPRGIWLGPPVHPLLSQGRRGWPQSPRTWRLVRPS